MVKRADVKNKKVASIMVLKQTNTLLKTTAKRLGFSNIESLIETFLLVRNKMSWSKFDMECVIKFGTIPAIIEGQAGSDEQIREQLGLQNSKKTGESFVISPVRIHSDLAIPFTEKVDLKDLNKKKDSEK